MSRIAREGFRMTLTRPKGGVRRCVDDMLRGSDF